MGIFCMNLLIAGSVSLVSDDVTFNCMHCNMNVRQSKNVRSTLVGFMCRLGDRETYWLDKY
jgi:hypothetical protein